MNTETLKLFFKYPRKTIEQCLNEKSIRNLKLIMTLVVKDEEDIIESNIRFHKAMGVDGFIVTSHNSTDRTNEILEKLKQEGIVLEIFYKTDLEHKHHIWVEDMIKTAKRKYKAVWVINADADEFYFSKDLNLKKSILRYKKTNVNVLKVDSTFLYPDGREDYLNCPYFVTRPFMEYQLEMLDIKQKEEFKLFTGAYCPKVIHKIKGFKRILDGNHGVKMRNKVEVFPLEIVLYHFYIRNYKGYEKKVKRWENSVFLMPEGIGEDMKSIVKTYQNGELKQNYDSKYNENMRKFLIEQGVVTIDKSVSNFLQLIESRGRALPE